MVPSVTPVAANNTSPLASCESVYFASKSSMPIRVARPTSSSFLNKRRPCICPPIQRRAAAANTPSGAPPDPTYKSTPVSFCALAITPETSPSEMSIILAPAFLTSLIISACRGLSNMQTSKSEMETFFASDRLARFSLIDLSRSTTPSGNPPPTAILSM